MYHCGHAIENQSPRWEQNPAGIESLVRVAAVNRDRWLHYGAVPDLPTGHPVAMAGVVGPSSADGGQALPGAWVSSVRRVGGQRQNGGNGDGGRCHPRFKVRHKSIEGQ